MNIGDLILLSGLGPESKQSIGIIVGEPKKFPMSGYLHPVLLGEKIEWMCPEQIEIIQKKSKETITLIK